MALQVHESSRLLTFQYFRLYIQNLAQYNTVYSIYYVPITLDSKLAFFFVSIFTYALSKTLAEASSVKIPAPFLEQSNGVEALNVLM